MEHQLKYEEWFFQSDYDLETAQYLLQSGRNVYCIFMCHLSLEKALKGLFIKRLNQDPPKLHDLMYFVEKLGLTPDNSQREFLIWMNRKGITTRYTEDLKKMISQFSNEYTVNVYQQVKSIQQWIKHQ